MSSIQLPSNSATTIDDNEEMKSVPLIDYVQENPQLHLGFDGVTGQPYHTTIPLDDFDLTFLFKVLSIEKENIQGYQRILASTSIPSSRHKSGV